MLNNMAVICLVDDDNVATWYYVKRLRRGGVGVKVVCGNVILGKETRRGGVGGKGGVWW